MIVRRLRLSNYQTKKLIWHFVVDIPASKVSLIIRMNRNTVNRYFLFFRHLIYRNQMEEFHKSIKGEAEMDEAYFGGKRKRGVPGKRGRGTDKQPVFGIYEREGRVYTQIVPNCEKKTLQAIIRGRVSPETVIHTDKWGGYDGLVDVGFDKHKRINHSEAFSYGNGNHINGIENFWSFTKRRLSKFNGCKVNFVLHLKECEWRYKKSNQKLQKELVVLVRNYQKGSLI